MKTLKDVMPAEFKDYFDSRAYKFKDVAVVEEKEFGWPGSHKNVIFWVILENGYAVGWNESSSRGWSFPTVKVNGV